MASLKEIKGRINSITSTQKITSAMQMVSSAKLHRTQSIAEQTLAYSEQLEEILQSLLEAKPEIQTSFSPHEDVKNLAIVVCASNTGLCGSFNSNVWKALEKLIHSYESKGMNLMFYPVGKKIAKELAKAGYAYQDDFIQITDKLTYAKAAEFSVHLQNLYLTNKVDQIDLLYHHFHNVARQTITHKVYLPFMVELKEETEKSDFFYDYILEPSVEDLQQALFPKMLDLQIYTTFLDTLTAEHAARMTAMQTANDNANDLLQELTLQYNKTRQQTITNELLDIMGGSINS